MNAVSAFWQMMLDQLQCGNPDEKADVISRLSDYREMPEEVRDALLVALDDENIRVKEAAALQLGRQHEQRAVARLVRELLDSQSAIRATAALALGDICNSQAMVPLMTVAQATEDGTAPRASAVRALGLLPAAPHVIELLRELLKNDPLFTVRLEAMMSFKAQALKCGLGIPQILEVMRIAANDSNEHVRNNARLYISYLRGKANDNPDV